MSQNKCHPRLEHLEARDQPAVAVLLPASVVNVSAIVAPPVPSQIIPQVAAPLLNNIGTTLSSVTRTPLTFDLTDFNAPLGGRPNVGSNTTLLMDGFRSPGRATRITDRNPPEGPAMANARNLGQSLELAFADPSSVEAIDSIFSTAGR